MDSIENEDESNELFNSFNIAAFQYMEKQFRECPKCNAKTRLLCPECMIETNRMVEQSNGYIWGEQLQKQDLSWFDSGYAPWLAQELQSELSMCGQEALSKGIPVDIALKQSIKIQWIQTELARIGYKPESTDEPLSIKNGPRPQWMGSASELAYLLTELIEGNHLTPPPNGRKVGKEGNRAAVADALYDAIEIRDPATNEIVTREYFKSLLRPNSPDRGTFRKLFKIDRRQ